MITFYDLLFCRVTRWSSVGGNGGGGGEWGGDSQRRWPHRVDDDTMPIDWGNQIKCIITVFCGNWSKLWCLMTRRRIIGARATGVDTFVRRGRLEQRLRGREDALPISRTEEDRERKWRRTCPNRKLIVYIYYYEIVVFRSSYQVPCHFSGCFASVSRWLASLKRINTQKH